MACGSCNNQGLYPVKITQSSPNCDITFEQLIEWRDLFLYIKGENRISETGLDNKTFNIYLGSVASALYYTGDYCEIFSRLVIVRDVIPSIKTNLGL